MLAAACTALAFTPPRVSASEVSTFNALASEQWSLGYADDARGMNVSPAWSQTLGHSVTVAVIGDGTIPHRDLPPSSFSWDFADEDPVPNGDQPCDAAPPTTGSTHASGVIAAISNRVGIVGVAPGVSLQQYRVAKPCGDVADDSIANAVRVAAGILVPGYPANPSPANVILLDVDPQESDFGPFDGCPASLQSAIFQAQTLGSLVVAAHLGSYGEFPADCSGVILVGATTRSGAAVGADGSPATSIWAPGEDVLSTARVAAAPRSRNGSWPAGYERMSGGRVAAAHVAGALALLTSVQPAVTMSSAVASMRATARDISAACARCTAGLLDVAALVASVTPAPVITIPFADMSSTPGSLAYYPGQRVFVGWRGVEGRSAIVKLVSPTRTVTLAPKPAASNGTQLLIPKDFPVSTATLEVHALAAERGAVPVLAASRAVRIAAPLVRPSRVPARPWSGHAIPVSWEMLGAGEGTVDVSFVSNGYPGRPPSFPVTTAAAPSGSASVAWPAAAEGWYTMSLVPSAEATFTVDTTGWFSAIHVPVTVAWPASIAAGSSQTITVTAAAPAHGFPMRVSADLTFFATVDGRTSRLGRAKVRPPQTSTAAVVRFQPRWRGKTVTVTVSWPGVDIVDGNTRTYVLT